MSAVQLPRDAFGYIPGVGGRVHEAYEDFISDCTDVADWATNSVLSLAEAVRNAAAAYAESDQSAAGRLDQTGALHPGVK